MAEQTEEEILEEIKKADIEHKKRKRELIEKAKVTRQKELAKLGELTIKFLNKEIEIDELKSYAISKEYIKKEEK